MKRTRQRGFGIIELIIILVILLVLLIIGWVAFKKMPKKDTANKQPAQQQPAEQKQSEQQPAEQNQAAAPPAKGTITGHASYPSEGLPEGQEVCAELISNPSTVHCINVGKNPPQDLSYSLEVPVGDYHVFSRANSADVYRAYYNEFVTCGLHVNCPASGHTQRHTVSVKAGQTVKDVDPGDWYYQ